MTAHMLWDDNNRKKVIKYFNNGLSDEIIAKLMDTVPTVIRRRLKELKLFRTKMPSNPLSPWTNEELLDKLRSMDNPISSKMINPSGWVYAHRFGSWAKALALVGKTVPSRIKYTDEELLGILRESDIKTYNHFNSPESGTPSAVTYVNRFGSWSKAIELAGVSKNGFSMLESKETIVYLVEFNGFYKLGITQQNIKARFSGYPCYTVILTLRFPTLSEARALERTWLNNVKEYRTLGIGFPRDNGTTECFNYE